MKKSLLFLVSAMVLAACGANNDNDPVYNKSGNSINLSEDVDQYNGKQDNEQFGFVRQVKSPVPNGNNQAESVQWLDREKAALHISQLLVSLPNVHDASVVVTDQEVLIAYETDIDKNDKKARFEAADQVKRTALSAVPRWYHIYVTDDPTLRQNVANIASMNTRSPHKDEQVKSTVHLMLKRSPQGRKLNDGENPNGETTGDINNDLDRTNYREQFENNNK